MYSKLCAIGVLAVSLFASGTVAARAEHVRVGIFSLTSHSPSIIAQGKGYFKKEGLDVEFVTFQAAQPMAVAIASGDVDFGMTAMTAGLVNLASHGAIKIIGGALQEVPDVKGQQILVSKKAHDEGVTKPNDLKGRRFGITTAGSSFQYMASKIAEKEGFAPSTMRLVPLNSVPTVVASLKSGQIDAWAIVPNIADRLVASGSAYSIGAISDFIKGYQVTTVFTSTDLAKNHRDEVQRFIKALSMGIHDYNAAFVDKTMPQKEVEPIIEMIHKWVYTDRPLAKAGPDIRAGAMRINENAALNMGSIRDQLAWFKSENLVPQSVAIDTLVDPSFVKTF